MISSFILAAGLSFASQPGCETCHAEVAQSFAKTGMGQSVGDPAPATARFRHDASGSILSLSDRRHRIERDSLSAEYPVLLRIGSGKVGSSFAVRISGQWFQSPVSWFAQSKQFRISPGYEQEKYPDFDRRIRDECLYCHSSEKDGQPAAMGCERCHSEGQDHARKPSRANIINPARLGGAARDSVCEQCHLPGSVRIVNPGKHREDYKPGEVLENTWTTFVSGGDFRVASHSEQLAKSACLKASSSTLWCGSCHNPHPTRARPATSVDGVCQQCHQPHEGGLNRCDTCHMPKRGVHDVAHTTYTDHRIQIAGYGTLGREVPDLRAWRAPPEPYAQRNVALAWFEWAATTRDPIAMQQASSRVSELALSQIADGQILAAKGAIALQENKPAEAIEWFKRALKVEPGNAEAYFRLGRAEQAAGRLDPAIRNYSEAIRLDPLFFEAYVLCAQLHRSRGNLRSYREVLTRYLRHVPSSLAARQALARSSAAIP